MPGWHYDDTSWNALYETLPARIGEPRKAVAAISVVHEQAEYFVLGNIHEASAGGWREPIFNICPVDSSGYLLLEQRLVRAWPNKNMD